MTRTQTANGPNELAGELRTVIDRLAFHLRTPAMRHGITPTRLSALFALERNGPLRPGDLASRLGIAAASMSRLCDALEDAALVRRTSDPSDNRAIQLAITAHGVAELAEVRRAGTQELVDDIGQLSAEEREALATALPVLIALADKHLGPADDTRR
jgi:DNA-binding MarR family transcriptional regulator